MWSGEGPDVIPAVKPRFLLLVAFVAVPWPAQAQQDPVAIVRRAGNVYRGLSSLQADFVQVIEDTNLGDTLSSTGRLYLSLIHI